MYIYPLCIYGRIRLIASSHRARKVNGHARTGLNPDGQRRARLSRQKPGSAEVSQAQPSPAQGGQAKLGRASPTLT